MKNALIVVDMLNDFVYGKLACDRALDIIPNLKNLILEARSKDIPVIFTNDSHLADDPEMKVWGEHAMKGSDLAKVIPELEVSPKDYQIEKRNYSSFFETELNELLRSLDIDTVLITGLHTHMCCRHTAADAFQHGYNVVGVEDCLNAFTEEDHLSGIEYLKDVYGARIASSKEIIEEWNK